LYREQIADEGARAAASGIGRCKKDPASQGWVISLRETGLLGLYDVRGLRSFLAFDDLKFDVIAFLQALVPFCNQGTVMHEHIGSFVTADEPKPFSIVEPFNGSFQFHFLFLRGGGTQRSVRAPSMNYVKQV
jgi:hypothetical protein